MEAMRAAPPMRARRAATKPVAVMKKAMKVPAMRAVMIRRRPPMRKAVMTSPMKKDLAKVTPAKIHKRGVWYDALRCPELYDAAVASLKTNDLIEFEVMDRRSGARLGNCISEVIGQRMSGDKGLPLVLISPPVAEEETVRSWMNPSLAAPNALHLCKAAARLVDVGSESYYIHKVERFRVRSPSSVVEDWALAVHERQPDPVPLQGYRPPARPAAVEPELPPPLQAGEAGRGAAMAAVDELGREFEGGAAAPLDGGGRREAPGLLPPRLPGLGLPRHEGLLGPGLPPSGMEPGPATPVSGAGIRAAWGEPLARGFVAHAHEAQQRREPPAVSVRERLSLRIGRLHTIRTAKRLVADHKATDALPAPDSDVDEFKAARHDAKRERKRGRGRADDDPKRKKKKRRRKSTSSSSRSKRSSSSSEDSAEQLFREASSRSADAKRAQRDARHRPHAVLVESLAGISRLLPSGSDGAMLDKVAVYRKLPPLYVPYYTLILQPIIEASQQGGARNERECRTICEAMDALLRGDPLGSLMILLARLKAIETAVSPEGGGWNVAQHHELIPPKGSGLVSARDRENAARDQRDVLRTRGQIERAGPLRSA